MRTTVRLDERLLREAKAYAARERRTLTAVIDDALRQLLARSTVRGSGRGSVELITFRGTGVRRGVDLDDSAALADLMDEGDPVEKRR